jgi:hypothetical protein
MKTEPSLADTDIPTSLALERYLGSKQINDRTDDDKTLILASRRPHPNQEIAAVDADQSAATA